MIFSPKCRPLFKIPVFEYLIYFGPNLNLSDFLRWAAMDRKCDDFVQFPSVHIFEHKNRRLIYKMYRTNLIERNYFFFLQKRVENEIFNKHQLCRRIRIQI
jgi:hypothetical protein